MKKLDDLLEGMGIQDSSLASQSPTQTGVTITEVAEPIEHQNGESPIAYSAHGLERLPLHEATFSALPSRLLAEVKNRRTDSRGRQAKSNVTLPEGVTSAAWVLERSTKQNPRIRDLLGCLRAMEEIRESSYSLMRYSPHRLREIWDRILEVVWVLRNEIPPLLEGGSIIPALDQALDATNANLSLIEGTLLAEIDAVAETLGQQPLSEHREFLARSIGELYCFLQDTFGRIVSADPRSALDTDYLLAHRFSADVHESEWLYGEILDVEHYLLSLGSRRKKELAGAIHGLEAMPTFPDFLLWTRLHAFLDELIGGLVPRLQQLTTLPTLRIDELGTLVEHTLWMRTQSVALIEVFRTGRRCLEAIEATQGAETQAGNACRTVEIVLCGQLRDMLLEIDLQLEDLTDFISIWRKDVSRRRALMFRREQGGDN